MNIPEVETNNSNKVEVLVIGGTHQTRQTLIDDIRNNKDKTGEDICRKLAKGGNITKGMDPDRAQFSNWSIKEVEANDPNLEESLKTAEMAIVIITNLEEATRINDAIRRATIKITRTPGSYSKEESSCLVACVADEAAPSVKEEVDQNRRLGIKQGLTGNQLENFARRWQLPMQALNNYLMVDLGYIWDRDNGKYYLNRYST